MSRKVTCDKCGAVKDSDAGFRSADIEILKKIERSGEVAKAEGVSNLEMRVEKKDICPTCVGQLEEAGRQMLLTFFNLADDKE